MVLDTLCVLQTRHSDGEACENQVHENVRLAQWCLVVQLGGSSLHDAPVLKKTESQVCLSHDFSWVWKISGDFIILMAFCFRIANERFKVLFVKFS